MYPVRCTRAGPCVGYAALGEDPAPDVNAVLQSEQKRLSKAIIEAVIREASFNTGVQIALMFVPVIGQAIAGLLALLNMVIGKVYEKMMRTAIADTTEAVKKRAEYSQTRVQDAGAKVCDEEYPAAIQLAMSASTLNGLGSNIFEKAASAVSSGTKTVFKAATTVVRPILVDPQKQMKFLTTLFSPVGLPRVALKAGENVLITGAKALERTGAVKQGSVSAPLTDFRDQADDVLFSAQKMSSPFTALQEDTKLIGHHGSFIVAEAMDATGNHKGAEAVRKIGSQMERAGTDTMTAFTPTGSYNLFSGREGYLAARDACEHMKAQAFAAMDAAAADAIKKLQSPEGRHNTRVALAKALRQDPSFIAQAAELKALQDQQANPTLDAMAQLQAAAGPTSGSGVATTLGVAAAAAGAFFIAR